MFPASGPRSASRLFGPTRRHALCRRGVSFFRSPGYLSSVRPDPSARPVPSRCSLCPVPGPSPICTVRPAGMPCAVTVFPASGPGTSLPICAAPYPPRNILHCCGCSPASYSGCTVCCSDVPGVRPVPFPCPCFGTLWSQSLPPHRLQFRTCPCIYSGLYIADAFRVRFPAHLHPSVPCPARPACTCSGRPHAALLFREKVCRNRKKPLSLPPGIARFPRPGNRDRIRAA